MKAEISFLARTLSNKQIMEVLEVCKIAPSPSPPAEFSLPLTFFDLGFFRSSPAQRILYYSLTNELPHLDSIIHNLKYSLSLTLSHFLPLAGNLVWPHHSPDPFILYKPGDSISLTIAKTDADFNHLSADHVRKANESLFLVPELLPTSDTVAPAMSLQITLFPRSGFSIGISTNHVVADGKTSTTFLKSWASICSRLDKDNDSNLPTLPLELTPVFDRTIATKDPNGLQKLYAKYFGLFVPNPKLHRPLNEIISDDVVSGTFELTRADIENLRRQVVATSSSSTRRLTTFVLTFAYVSTCIVKAQQIDPKSKICLSIVVDWRPRVGETLGGLNYFGNGISGYWVFLEAREFEEENVMAVVSKRISDGIAEITENVSKGNNNFVEMLEELLGRYGKEMPISKLIVVSGSPRFGVYDADFGWGKCKKVEMVIGNFSMDSGKGDGGNFSMDSRKGDGGLEVRIALPENEMNVFSSLFFEGLKQ